MVTELAAPFDMTRVAVAKHLRVLESAGLVSRTIEGRIHRCSMSAEPLREIEHWLDDYRVFWTRKLDALARFAESEDTIARPAAESEAAVRAGGRRKGRA